MLPNYFLICLQQYLKNCSFGNHARTDSSYRKLFPRIRKYFIEQHLIQNYCKFNLLVMLVNSITLFFLGLCLVNHESGFQYDVVHENSDGSKDYGIYQLNDNYWCDRGDTKYSSCWQINTFGCGYQCSGESCFIDPI